MTPPSITTKPITPTTMSCVETPTMSAPSPIEHEDRAVDDVAIAQRATVGGRADHIGVIAHEMAFHLVEQTLLLFGEWHASPSACSDPSILRAPSITRLGPCHPPRMPSKLFPSV